MAHAPSSTSGNSESSSQKNRDWLTRRQVKRIKGALKPAAYVQRAYQWTRKQGGALPEWARKTADGSWLFQREYIRRDARINQNTLGVTEAARMLNTSRRTIQNWIDEGVLPADESPLTTAGKGRRILREEFFAMLPALRERLHQETPSGDMKPNVAPLASAPVPPTPEPESSPAPDAATRKRRAAENLEQRLRAARETKITQQAVEQTAHSIAQRLLNAVFDERFSRLKGMQLYNQITESKNIPRDIRIRIRKKFFGH